MSSDDHLSNEVSIIAEMTPTGVTAKAKSRFISGIDRLGGNLTEWVNVRIEAGTSLRRARVKGEERLLEAAVQYGVDRLGKDPDFAERALQHHFQETLGKQANREAVIEEAIADLRRSPPTDAQAHSGAERLDPILLDRIADYAGGASTEALREKWGRVMASEIRSPGHFSLKVLRIVDELEPDVARIFEELCKHRLGDSVPVASFRNLSQREIAALDGAGLLIEPGLGHTISPRKITDEEGDRLHLLFLGNRAISVPWDTGLKGHRIGPGKEAIELVGEDLQIPVHALTAEGVAIATMLPYNENAAVERLAELINTKVPGTKTYTLDPASQKLVDD